MADARRDNDGGLVEDQGNEEGIGLEIVEAQGNNHDELVEDQGNEERLERDVEQGNNHDELADDQGNEEDGTADEADEADEDLTVLSNDDFVLLREPRFLRMVDEAAAVGRSHEVGEAAVPAEDDEVVDFFKAHAFGDEEPGLVFKIFDLHLMCLSNAHAESLLHAVKSSAASVTNIQLDTLWGNRMPEAPPSRRARLAMARRLAAVLSSSCSALATIVVDALYIATVPTEERDFVVQVISIFLKACKQVREVVLPFESVGEAEYHIIGEIARAIAERPTVERLKVGCLENVEIWRLVCHSVAKMRRLKMFAVEIGHTLNVNRATTIEIATDDDAWLLHRILTLKSLREVSISRFSFTNAPVSEIFCHTLAALRLRRLMVCSTSFAVATQPTVAMALGTANVETLEIDCCAGVPSVGFFENLGVGLNRNTVMRKLRLSAWDWSDDDDYSVAVNPFVPFFTSRVEWQLTELQLELGFFCYTLAFDDSLATYIAEDDTLERLYFNVKDSSFDGSGDNVVDKSKLLEACQSGSGRLDELSLDDHDDDHEPLFDADLVQRLQDAVAYNSNRVWRIHGPALQLAASQVLFSDQVRLLCEAYAGLEFEVIFQFLRNDLAGNRSNLCSLLVDAANFLSAEEQVSDTTEQASIDVIEVGGSDARDTWGEPIHVDGNMAEEQGSAAAEQLSGAANLDDGCIVPDQVGSKRKQDAEAADVKEANKRSRNADII